MEIVSEAIENYTAAHTSELPAHFKALEEETRKSMQYHFMQVGKTEGSFLRMLVRLMGATRIIEVGTFTGFSALCMVEALPENGRLITCDIDKAAADIAKRFWAQSPHGAKIELRLGPAMEIIAALEGPFDMAFIDADKDNYENYWEALLPKVRQGGLLVVDNVLWEGRVLNPVKRLDIAIDAFNKKVASDPRVEALMLTVRDGVTLARKV